MILQEVAVYLIVFIAVAYTIYQIVKAFTSKNSDQGCSHCMGSCHINYKQKKLNITQK